jgi:hypothetical protein
MNSPSNLAGTAWADLDDPRFLLKRGEQYRKRIEDLERFLALAEAHIETLERRLIATGEWYPGLDG